MRSTGCAQGDLSGDVHESTNGVGRSSICPGPCSTRCTGPEWWSWNGPVGLPVRRATPPVATASGAALAVLTADCAPVAFASPEGVLGIAHAGWRGLRAGVVEATVTTMRRLGATRVEAVIGPCIHPCCYPFGAADLDRLTARLGEPVRAVDRNGAPALDLPAGVRVALHSSGAVLVGDAATCTSCSDDHWSWRQSAAPFRQATVVWRP